MGLNELAEHLLAVGGIEVDDLDAIFAKPLDTSLKCVRFADDHRTDPELPNQAAAIPTWSQRRHHYGIAITPLPPGLSKRIRFAVDRWVALLHTSVMTAAKEITVAIEQRRTYRDPALAETQSSFLDRDLQ